MTAQRAPPLRQLRASINQRLLGVEKFSVNGTLSLNCLSHLRGQAHKVIEVLDSEVQRLSGRNRN